MAKLYSQLLFDSQYAADMVNFIDIIICNLIINILLSKNIQQEAMSANMNKSDEKFAPKLYKNSNFVASKIQIYFSLQNATYFKFEAAANRKYQFDFSYLCIDKTKIIELKSIDVSWNNPWVNSWNSSLVLITKSNYDINFILFNVKTLAFIHSITNYATKKDFG